jgi:hypothetical protein
MKSFYDKTFLNTTVEVISDLIDDLEAWSANNDEEHNEEIAEIRQAYLKLKKAVK